ncbi:hypothetical protein [Litoribacillus peritrichatus]|uniref:Uncharacterized protein n=1 Tax=Litoribacillus peritrichatus TaxID=718191 RepID=A0ABP7MBQ3_9GAMM
MKSIEFILEKVKSGDFCERNEYQALFKILVKNLSEVIKMDLDFDLDPVEDPCYLRGYVFNRKSELGILDVSLRSNLMVFFERGLLSLKADVFIYFNGQQVERNYLQGSYMEFSYSLDDLQWKFERWIQDEHNEYESWLFLD